MRTKMQRWALQGVVMGCLLSMGLVAPANAVGTTQISGVGVDDDAAGSECGLPPAPFDDAPGLILTGSLDGCLFTEVLTDHGTPSGVYHQTGRELIVASMNGGPVGRFTTTYSSSPSGARTCRPAWRSRAAASTRSSRAPGPASSRARPDGSTSRTRSAPGCSSTEGTSSSADAVAPFRRHAWDGQAATSPRLPRRQRTLMPRCALHADERMPTQNCSTLKACG